MAKATTFREDPEFFRSGWWGLHRGRRGRV